MNNIPINTFFTINGRCPFGESCPPSIAIPRPQLSLNISTIFVCFDD